MSSTNKTANYELSQFVGTDIPSILSDYNGDMRKIDAGIAEVATSAGSSASAVSALAGRVTTAENNITSLNGALEVTNQRSIQNQTAITAVQGVIPSDASTENKLATVEEVGDVADNVRGVDDRVQAIEDVVPSTASSSNKLATMQDIPSSPTQYIGDEPIVIENGHIKLEIGSDYTSYASNVPATMGALLELIRTKLLALNFHNNDLCESFTTINLNGDIYHFSQTGHKFTCVTRQHTYVLDLAIQGSCVYWVDNEDKSSDAPSEYGTKSFTIYYLVK